MELILMDWVSKAYTLPSGRLVPQTRNVQTSCPMKILQSMKKKNWAGGRTAQSSCGESGAAELPRAPGQPCQLLKSVKALGEEPPQVVNCCWVWKLWHWLMQWWCLVLQQFGVSPFIREGWGSRPPLPGSWAAVRLAGQAWEGFHGEKEELLAGTLTLCVCRGCTPSLQQCSWFY